MWRPDHPRSVLCALAPASLRVPNRLTSFVGRPATSGVPFPMHSMEPPLACGDKTSRGER